MARKPAPIPLALESTNAFLKDLERMVRRGKDREKLGIVIETLCNRGTLAARHRDHALVGEWKGTRDCHIEPDWVLIYRVDESGNELQLIRTGTHSDLCL